MELRQIQYFIQLYKDRNITKASQNLFISQQGLSKSIAKLEEELGFSLFERSASGAAPTRTADRLYPYFEQVLISYQGLSTEIDHLSNKRILKIAAPDGFSLACDKDEFAEYSKLHPDVEIIYREYPNRELPQLLSDHKADIAFVLAPLPDSLQSYALIATEPLYAVMDSRHPLAGKTSICVSDLKEQSLLLLDSYQKLNKSITDQLDVLGFSYAIHYSSLHEFLQAIYSTPLIGFSSKTLFQHFNFPEISFLPLTTADGSDIIIESHLAGLKGIKPNREMQRYIDYETEQEHMDLIRRLLS